MWLSNLFKPRTTEEVVRRKRTARVQARRKHQGERERMRRLAQAASLRAKHGDRVELVAG